jgi:hypothetical protein
MSAPSFVEDGSGVRHAGLVVEVEQDRRLVRIEQLQDEATARAGPDSQRRPAHGSSAVTENILRVSLDYLRRTVLRSKG